MYLIPPVASAVLLGLLWSQLSHPRLAGACWLAAALLQFVVGEPYNTWWLGGLVLNTALGVALSIRLKMA